MLAPDTTRSSQNLLLIVSLVLLVLALPIAATAQCPTNTVTVEGTTYGNVDFYVSGTSTDPSHAVSHGRSTASYDLMDGSLYAHAYVDESNIHRSRVIAVDRFVLNNALSAVLKVRLYLSFFWMADPSGRMAWADGIATLTIGCQTVTASSYWQSIAPYIELDVTAEEGVPFEVTYETSAIGEGYYPIATMSCRLEFLNVPAGAEITSCNGYGSSQTPVEPTTWGTVKALYQ